MKMIAIAWVTVREMMRRKLQVNLLLFAGLLIIASYVLSGLTLGERHRMISDLGLTAMRFVGSLLAAFLGAGLVAGDIDRRVIAPVVTKPIARAEYLLGRYVGLALVVIANLVVMSVVLALVLVLDASSLRPIDSAYAAAIAFLGVQFLVIASVAILFSCITNSMLAAIFTLAVTIAGQLTNEMRALWKDGPVWIAKVIWYLVPNLGVLNANEAVIYRSPPSAGAWLGALYGVMYASTVVALAAAAFERREIR
jgi:ABC-type transport system involved in multi-copper enzyme maturation permease subunit